MWKKILCLAAAVALICPAKAQPSLTQLWDEANNHYTSGEYGEAIGVYDSILNEGYSSAKLYYNLGNAYFKNEQLGKAILNYYKAQRLSPADEDIEYNLRIANSYVKDRIENIPEFFLTTWFRSLRNSASSNTWAVLSLVFFGATLAGAAFYLIGRGTGVRKTGFYGGIVFLILFVVSLLFSAIRRSEIRNPQEAVIMLSAAPVKSSPDNNSKDIFVLHEGTKVKVGERLGDWREITVANGSKGWIEARSMEMID